MTTSRKKVKKSRITTVSPEQQEQNDLINNTIEKLRVRQENKYTEYQRKLNKGLDHFSSVDKYC